MILNAKGQRLRGCQYTWLFFSVYVDNSSDYKLLACAVYWFSPSPPNLLSSEVKNKKHSLYADVALGEPEVQRTERV